MCAEASRIPPASASSSEAAKKVQLTVTTGDTTSEIFVVDGDLRLCARSIGKLDTWLTPGIYKVRVRTALSALEEFVVLRDAPVSKSFQAIPFSTPVPLVNTAKTHEYHQRAAVEHSAKTHVVAGQGSSIFVFARDWTPNWEVNAGKARPWLHPAKGLELKSIDGAPVANIQESSATSQEPGANQGPDPWAACTIAVNPGAYQLSVDTPEGEFAQTVIAPSGWHVHIFLLQHFYGADEKKPNLPSTSVGAVETRPDLASAAVMLSQTQQFTPDGDEARLVELARLGLKEQRKVLSSELRQMLTAKFNDPMLGILAGHLILMDTSPDLGLLETVVNNLRGLLPTVHPDVEALSLRLSNNVPLEVSVPPMLRRSWALILDATADQRAMVARGSAAAKIIGHVCAVDPWLVCVQSPPEVAGDEYEAPEKIYQQALDEHLESVEAAAGQGAQQFVEPESAPTGGERMMTIEPRSVNEQKVKQLIHALGVPRYYVEDLLKNSGFDVTEK